MTAAHRTAPMLGVPDAAPTGARSRMPSGPAVVALGAALVGFTVRLVVLLRTGGLLGSSAYDDGVYYAAAAAVVHGRWPYADFLLLHPPGITLALAPFAALGSVLGDPVGVIAGRIAWIGLGAAGCALVALLAGRRSTTSALVAGGFAACFFPLAYSERSTLLEPPATVLLLGALLLIRRGTARATVVAGVLAGLTVDLKIWYVVPVLVLAVLVRGRGRFLLAAAASAAAIALPFLLRAPEAMVRQVLIDQLGRARLTGPTLLDRLAVITGARFTAGASDPPAPVLLVVTGAIVVLLVAASIAAWRTTSTGRPAVVLLASSAVVLLASPSFFTHYVAFTGPWTALVLGLGAGAVVERVRLPRTRIASAALLTLLASTPTLGMVLAPAAPTADLRPLAVAAERMQGCIRSDDPGLLAAIGALSPDLDRGCALWPDVTGVTYDSADLPTDAAARPGSARWQSVVDDYLLGGDAVIVSRPATGLSARSRERIAELPELARSGSLVLRVITR